jgi:hypothetical protein
VDGLPSVLYQLCVLHPVSVRSNPVADKVTNWTVIAIAIAACVAAFVIHPLPQGMEPSSVATTGLAIAGLYFLIKKYFSRERVDALAVSAPKSVSCSAPWSW